MAQKSGTRYGEERKIGGMKLVRKGWSQDILLRKDVEVIIAGKDIGYTGCCWNLIANIFWGEKYF